MIKHIALALVLSVSSALFAAEPAIPPGMQATWQQFQDALRKDSPEALSLLCRFPLVSNEFGGTIKTAAILKSRYSKIFTQKTKQCLLGQTPKRETHDKKEYFEAFCDNDIYPIRYIFEKVGSSYLLVSIDNINE